jgi:hypothetical protein
MLVSAPGPPSSHTSLLNCAQSLLQIIGGGIGGGGEGGGDGGGGDGGEKKRGPQSSQSVPHGQVESISPVERVRCGQMSPTLQPPRAGAVLGSVEGAPSWQTPLPALHVLEHDIGGGSGGGLGGVGGGSGGGPVHGRIEREPRLSTVWKAPPLIEMVTGRTCGYG